MIKIKESDVVYKLDKSVCNLNEIQIPENATVFDASDCSNFCDLKGLQKYSNLRVLLLKGTDINGSDLNLISSNIKEIDIRHCKNIKNYSRLPKRKETPIRVLISFVGERILNTMPDEVDIEFEGWLNTITRKKTPTVFIKQNTRI